MRAIYTIRNIREKHVIVGGFSIKRFLIRASLPFLFMSLTAHQLAVAENVESYVRNGEALDQSEWPAVFIFMSKDGALCTSTVVGEGAVLTAAHCTTGGRGGRIGKTIVDPDENRTIKNGTEVICEPYSRYKTNEELDYALCTYKVDSAKSLGRPYESLSVQNNELTIDVPLTMVGYGCTGYHISNDEGTTIYEDLENLFTFGELHGGSAKIVELPDDSNPYITTEGTTTTCVSDSGGPAFIDVNGVRAIVGVSKKSSLNRKSFFAPIANEDFIEWIRKWLQNRPEVKICGISSDATNCRQSNPVRNNSTFK